MDKQQIDALLTSIGPLVDADGMTTTEDDLLWSLEFEHDSDCFLEAGAREGQYVLSGEVAPLPDTGVAELLRTMLIYNDQSAETGGARLALDGEDGGVTLSIDLNSSELGESTLEGLITSYELTSMRYTTQTSVRFDGQMHGSQYDSEFSSKVQKRAIKSVSHQQKNETCVQRLKQSGLPEKDWPVLTSVLNQGLFEAHQDTTRNNPDSAPMPFMPGDGGVGPGMAGVKFEFQPVPDEPGKYDFVATSEKRLGNISDIPKKDEGFGMPDVTDPDESKYLVQITGRIDCNASKDPVTITNGQAAYQARLPNG